MSTPICTAENNHSGSLGSTSPLRGGPSDGINPVALSRSLSAGLGENCTTKRQRRHQTMEFFEMCTELITTLARWSSCWSAHTYMRTRIQIQLQSPCCCTIYFCPYYCFWCSLADFCDTLERTTKQQSAELTPFLWDQSSDGRGVHFQHCWGHYPITLLTSLSGVCNYLSNLAVPSLSPLHDLLLPLFMSGSVHICKYLSVHTRVISRLSSPLFSFVLLFPSSKLICSASSEITPEIRLGVTTIPNRKIHDVHCYDEYLYRSCGGHPVLWYYFVCFSVFPYILLPYVCMGAYLVNNLTDLFSWLDVAIAFLPRLRTHTDMQP